MRLVTVRRWCERNKLPARKVGGHYKERPMHKLMLTIMLAALALPAFADPPTYDNPYIRDPLPPTDQLTPYRLHDHLSSEDTRNDNQTLLRRQLKTQADQRHLERAFARENAWWRQHRREQRDQRAKRQHQTDQPKRVIVLPQAHRSNPTSRDTESRGPWQLFAHKGQLYKINTDTGDVIRVDTSPENPWGVAAVIPSGDPSCHQTLDPDSKTASPPADAHD
jgi:hypothetical protein